jgi:hypothetical protein
LSAKDYNVTLFLPNCESGHFALSGPSIGRPKGCPQPTSSFTYHGCKSFSSIKELVDLAHREPVISEGEIDQIYVERKQKTIRAKREAENNAAFSQKIALVVTPLYVSAVCYIFGCFMKYIHSTIF